MPTDKQGESTFVTDNQCDTFSVCFFVDPFRVHTQSDHSSSSEATTAQTRGLLKVWSFYNKTHDLIFGSNCVHCEPKQSKSETDKLADGIFKAATVQYGNMGLRKGFYSPTTISG